MNALERLGLLCARYPWRVIAGWFALAVVLLGAGRLAGATFTNDFRLPGAESERAVSIARAHVPSMGASAADIVLHRRSGALREPAAADAIAAMLSAIRSQPGVSVARNPLLPPTDPEGGGLLSQDARTAVVTVEYDLSLGEIDPGATERLMKAAEPLRGVGVETEFRGQVVDRAFEPETGGSDLIGLAVALVVLLVAFGSVVAAGLPIVVALVGLMSGSALVLLLGSVMDVPTSAPIVAVMLGLGAGIDYALFIVTAFRQRLSLGDEPQTAVGRAVESAGHAVLFAGGTVLVAILGLLLSGIPFIGAIGVAAALTVAAMMLTALTLLPAMLSLLGPRVNLGRVHRRPVPATSAGTGPGRWHVWGSHVGRHRVGYALISVAVLGALSAPALALRTGTPDDSNRSTEQTQRRAYDLVSDHLGAGWNGPLLVVVSGPTAAGSATAERLVTALRSDPAVRLVPPPVPSPDGEVQLLTVVPTEGPQSLRVSELVHRLRDSVGPDAVRGSAGVSIAVGGPTAFLIDMADLVAQRLVWVVGAVVLTGGLLLWLMFRAPLIAVKAALMALLSIGAAFGALVMVAQWGWGLSLTGIPEPVPINSVVLLLLFAILFGLSMDYEVFLLSATRRAYDESGDVDEAIASGLEVTGRVITAAAAIMAVVFLSFLGIDDTLVKLTGLGLAVAVIVDATVMRVVLGPAVLSLLRGAAWWPHRPPRGSGSTPVGSAPVGVAPGEPSAPDELPAQVRAADEAV